MTIVTGNGDVGPEDRRACRRPHVNNDLRSVRGGITPYEHIQKIPNKVGGIEGIDGPFFKSASVEAIEELDSMMSESHATGYMPMQSHLVRVALLDKPVDPNDDRPICLVSHYYRIMADASADEIRAWEETWVGP